MGINPQNKTISLMRGDSLSFTAPINLGSFLYPSIHELEGNEALYFGVMEPGAAFEDAVIKKKYTADSDKDTEGNIVISLDPMDTLKLSVGKYYYMIKWLYFDDAGEECVRTITTPTLFWLEGNNPSNEHIDEDFEPETPVRNDSIEIDTDSYKYSLNKDHVLYGIYGESIDGEEPKLAAGIVFTSRLEPDKVYPSNCLMDVKGNTSFASGLNIRFVEEAGASTGPDYSQAFGAHHTMSGYGSAVFGNGNRVYARSQYSLTAGRNLSNYGSKAIIAGESTNRFADILQQKGLSIDDVMSSSQMLEVFKTSGNGKEVALAYGNWSVNFGANNITYGKGSIALGEQNFSGGEHSSTFGRKNESVGKYSTSLGIGNHVEGEASAAIGSSNRVVKIEGIGDPLGSIAIGYSNLVTNGYSLAGGHHSSANHYGSFSLGLGIKSSRSNSLIVGEFNDNSVPAVLFGVGNGSGSPNDITLSEDGTYFIDNSNVTRSNAFCVFKAGYAEVQNQGNTDISVVQKKYVDKVKSDVSTLSQKVSAQKEYTDQSVDSTKQLMYDILIQDVFRKQTFEDTESNSVQLYNLTTSVAEINASMCYPDRVLRNLIVDDGVISSNTLTLPAWSAIVNIASIVPNPDNSEELVMKLEDGIGYYRGWKTYDTPDSSTKIGIPLGKTYTIEFEYKGNVEVHLIDSYTSDTTPRTKYSSEEWSKVVQTFYLNSSGVNYNYIMALGSFDGSFGFIKNFKVRCVPDLIINNETIHYDVDKGQFYSYRIFDCPDVVTLDVLNLLDNSFTVGLKGTYTCKPE